MPVYLTVLLYPVRLLVLECSAVGPRFLFVDLHRVLRGGGLPGNDRLPSYAEGCIRNR